MGVGGGEHDRCTETLETLLGGGGRSSDDSCAIASMTIVVLSLLWHLMDSILGRTLWFLQAQYTEFR